MALAQVSNPSRTVREALAKRPLRKSPTGNGKAAAQDGAHAALRAANAEVRRADHAAEANRKGTERARELVREANSAVEHATAAVRKAQARATADAEKAMLAGKPLALVNTALDTARAREKAAIDQAAMAQVACENLESRQRELDNAAGWAREKDEKAISEVIKQFPLRRFLTETQKMHDQYASRRVILWKLLFGKLVEGEDKEAVEKLMRSSLPPHPDQGSPIDWNATPAARAWEAMRAALAADADAPVEIGS
jgi:hypothetical protein